MKDKDTIFLILLNLEQMRLKIEHKEIESTSDDCTIRICQAEIAEKFLKIKSRKEWTDILKFNYGLVY